MPDPSPCLASRRSLQEAVLMHQPPCALCPGLSPKSFSVMDLILDPERCCPPTGPQGVRLPVPPWLLYQGNTARGAGDPGLRTDLRPLGTKLCACTLALCPFPRSLLSFLLCWLSPGQPLSPFDIFSLTTPHLPPPSCSCPSSSGSGAKAMLSSFKKPQQHNPLQSKHFMSDMEGT